MTELKKRYQRPEGVLLEEALFGPPKTSIRQFAKDVGMSEGRVRQIINGYQSQAGQVLEIRAPAETLARFALTAGVSPEALLSVGRGDAADILQDVLDRQNLENAPESIYYKPEGEDAEQVVTWGFMEARLGELEERIVRLERQALRASGRGPLVALEGGDGDGGSAPTSDVSEVGDDLPAAAKTGRIEEPGEPTY